MKHPGTAAVLLVLLATSGHATDLRGTIGHTTFIDESLVDHLFTGASARFYLTRKLGAGRSWIAPTKAGNLGASIATETHSR